MQKSIYRALITAFPSLRWHTSANATSLAALIATRGVKTTTGIVGIPVDENARQNYIASLNELLEAIKVVPADAEYRVSIETTVNSKLKALHTDASDEELEDQFGFQLEQCIKMCREELALVPKMAEWAPWDVPAGHKVEFVQEEEVEQKIGGAAAPPPPPPPPPPAK